MTDLPDTSFYPPQPKTGSNAIGSFEIGVSQIGTIPPFNWRDTVISQYANSPVLMQLIADFSSCLDQTANMDDFFDLIWNVDTAQGHGLDVWGRIVGVTRTLEIASAGPFFGFEETGDETNDTPFNQAPFYSGGPATSNYDLSDNAFRQLILAKALANITDGSIPSLNMLLMALFPGEGNAYVTDGEDMSMTYTFSFKLTAIQQSIVYQSNVLPRPVGVSITIVTP